jgi:hypothetical protein
LTIIIEYLIDQIDPTPVLVDQDMDATTHQFPNTTHYYPQSPAGQKPADSARSTDSIPKAGQAKTGDAKTGQAKAATAPAPGAAAPASADSAGDSSSTGNSSSSAASSPSHEPEALKTGLANYKKIPAGGCGVTTANVMVLYDAANAAGDSVSAVSGLVSQSWGGWGLLLPRIFEVFDWRQSDIGCDRENRRLARGRRVPLWPPPTGLLTESASHPARYRRPAPRRLRPVRRFRPWIRRRC